MEDVAQEHPAQHLLSEVDHLHETWPVLYLIGRRARVVRGLEKDAFPALRQLVVQPGRPRLSDPF